MSDCIFCRIVAGEAPCHRIWEDDDHLAFLSINPNTEGFAVVVTKTHHPSDVLALPDPIVMGLTLASKAAAAKLTAAFDDVGRTGLIYEGYGVDHAHAKLFPMHGTAEEVWKPRLSNVDKWFDAYEGYISSHGGRRMDDAMLAAIAAKIRGE